jgi:predicted AlkP superfamily pyrophosphatase or phosphodiesterase
LLGDYIDEEGYCSGAYILETFLCDWRNMHRVRKKIENIEEEDFDFLFLYFDGLDDTAHLFGWCSFFYLWQISVLDHYIGNILNSLKNKGILDDTYVLLTADHGGRPVKIFIFKNVYLFEKFLLIRLGRLWTWEARRF